MADAPFTWGAGGARLTPEEIAQRRKDASLLVQQGTDASPLPVGTRGFGMATQGLARVAKALMGGLDAREADQAAKANFADNTKMRSDMMDAHMGKTAPSPAVATVTSAMPDGAPSSNAPHALDPETQGYINAAATKFGVDPSYLTRTAQIESGGNPNAVNPNSGAKGLFQFMPKTAKEYELDNPLDPEDSAMAAAELAKDNRDSLTQALGRPPTNAELYLAHQQGASGAARLITNSNANASSLLGHAAVLNNGGADSMTGSQFANMWLNKYGGPAAPIAKPVQVASADPSFVPAAAPAPAAPNPNVAKVAGALGLSPSTVAGAQYPSPLQANTGPALPLQGNIAGMPPVAPMSSQAPVRFAGQPGFVPPVARPVAAPAPVVAASDDEEKDTSTQGVAPVASPAAAAASPAAVAASPAAAAASPAAVAKVTGALAPPNVAPVTSGIQNVDPNVLRAFTSPYSDDATKKMAGIILQQQMTPKEVHAQTTDKDGNVYDVNRLTGERKVILKADSDPTSVKEYNFYTSHLPAGQQPMPYDVWSTAKARAGAVSLSNIGNVDMNSGQTYDKQLAEGLGKAHAGLANGVEDAQTRARDISAMQGAVDQIQKNGGTTGGMAPAARLELQKSINAGAAALGIDKPFSEADISDKEFLTKFNRSMAGAQAKNAVGSRVTNFEMSNFMKANPGIDMTITGNQRLLGIQAQIEQRNIAVGNQIRQATAQAISGGKKIDPVTVQKIITDYDAAHHVQDPMTGQDLTQSLTLPEFQQGGTNAALAAQHNANMGPTEKVIGGKTYEKRPDGHWYEKL